MPPWRILPLDAEERHERERDRRDARAAPPAAAAPPAETATMLASEPCWAAGSAGSAGWTSGQLGRLGVARLRGPNAATSAFWAWISRRSCSTQRGQLRRCTSSRAPRPRRRARRPAGRTLAPPPACTSRCPRAARTARRSARCAPWRARAPARRSRNAELRGGLGPVAAREHHERERLDGTVPASEAARDMGDARRGSTGPAGVRGTGRSGAYSTPRKHTTPCSLNR